MTIDTTETVYMDADLYIVTNEDGNVTADEDRDTAIERMSEDYGGQTLRVTEMTIKIPRPRDAKANLTLPIEGGETIKVAVTE